MLQIAVCIKQVPKRQTTMDSNTGSFVRIALNSGMNMYDYSALETAMRMKEQVKAQVTAITMGPPSSEQVLKEAAAMGADRLILVTDKAFAGADVLATSYTLSHALNAAGQFDLILCGKQTTDGDTAQVGGMLAGWRSISYLPWVCEIRSVYWDRIQVLVQMDQERVEIQAEYPCLLAVEPSIYKARIPTLSGRIRSRSITVEWMDAASIGVSENKIGQKGSATKVVQIEQKQEKKESNLLYLSPKEAVRFIEQIREDENENDSDNSGLSAPQSEPAGTS